MPPLLRRGSIGDGRKIVGFSNDQSCLRLRRRVLLRYQKLSTNRCLTQGLTCQCGRSFEDLKVGVQKSNTRATSFVCSICRYFGTHAQGPYKPLLACLGQFHSWTESSFSVRNPLPKFPN